VTVLYCLSHQGACR